MAGTYLKQSIDKNHQDAYQDVKTVQVQPEETQRVTSVSAPDAQTQQFMQANAIKPLQQAYGIDPNTGKATPFEVLGYDPEEERKRRAAEQRLNDWKRKENAWYNAFALAGDAITTALGGNVWKREPNHIGAKANSDNQRLIAEQKADDMRNAAMVRNAGIDYANNVNKIIQNYLTRTTDTTKTGGNRMEITQHGAKDGWAQHSHALGSASASASAGGGGSYKRMNIVLSGQNGSENVQSYDLTKPEYEAVSEIVKTKYTQILHKGFSPNATPQERQAAESLRNDLINSGALISEPNPATGSVQYKFDYDAILQNGRYWQLSDMERSRIEKATGGKVRFVTDEYGHTKPIPPYKNKKSNNNNIPPYKRK